MVILKDDGWTGCGGDGGDDSSGGEVDEGPREEHEWTETRLQVFHSQPGNCERARPCSTPALTCCIPPPAR